MDFAGLSFGAPSPVKRAPEPVVVAPPPAPVEEEVAAQEPKVEDRWDTKGLVDLDLAGRNVQPQKRASVTQGPTLDNMMGVAPAARRASLNANPLDPFGAPSLLQQQSKPASASTNNMYGGGYGGQPVMPPAPQAPVYGRGLAAGPAPPMFAAQPPAYGQQPSFGQQPGFGQQPVYGQQPGFGQQPAYGQPAFGQPPMGAMGANTRGSIGGMPYGGGYQAPGQQQQAPKSSLDSLTWK